MQGIALVIIWALAGVGAGLCALRLVNWLLARYGNISPLPVPPKPLPTSRWGWACGVVAGLLFAAAALGQPGGIPGILAASLYVLILGVIFLVDLRAHLILDVVTFPALLLVLVVTVFQRVIDPEHHWQRSVAGALVGLVLFGLLYGLGWLVTRQEAMGLGDVKLATLAGMMVGIQHVLPAFLLAIVGGGVISALLLVFRRRGAGSFIPYGVFIAAGAAFFVLAPESLLTL